MSEEILKGRLEAPTSNIMDILHYGTAPVDERYDQMYVNLSLSGLQTIANAGESVVAYCTFDDTFVQDIELHDSIDEDAGMEAIVSFPHMKQYLKFVGGERISLEFYGSEDRRGCSTMRISGDLSAKIYLPSSESDYTSKALKVVGRYDEDNHWIKSDGDTLSTSFATTAEQFEKIVSVKSFDNLELSTYPVVVKDGAFRLDVSDDNNRDEISGELWSEDVEGPDVENHYTRAFDELFSVVSGKLFVQTEQDSLLNIVREPNDGSFELRYTILPAA